MATHSGNTKSADNHVPPEVTVDSESGVDPQALKLAQAFMEKVGGLARLTRRRGDLSHLYICTMASWADPKVMEDVSQQRHFKQVLFALAHGMRLVRVVGDGRTLLWNRYRDNSGNEVEDRRPNSNRSERRRPGRYQKGGDGDRRERRSSE